MEQLISKASVFRWLVATVAALAFYLFSDQFLAPPDCAFYWAWADALLRSFSFEFGESFAGLQIPQWYCYVVPETGRLANDWPMGTGLMVLPVAWAGAVAAHVWILLLLGAVLHYWWSQTDGASRGTKAAALVALFAGTPLLFYGLFAPFFSHIPSFIVCSAFLVCWAGKWSGSTAWRLFSCGVLLGFAVLIRPQNALLAIVFLFDVSALLARFRNAGAVVLRETVVPLAAGLVLGLLPRFYSQWVIYGNPLSMPKLEEMNWLSPNFLPMLFSDYHGMLPWTPLYAVAIIGLIMGVRTRPRLYGALLAVFVSQLYVNAANEVWWSGGSFGNRRMTDYSIVVAWGLLPLFTHARRYVRVGSTVMTIACCAWTMTLLLAERRLLVPLDRYIPFASPDFLPAVARVFTEPTETWKSLARRAYVIEPMKLLWAAVLFGGLLLVLQPGLRRLSARQAGIALAGFGIVLQGIVGVAALRTPAQSEEVIAATESESKILWDNYNELAGYYLVKAEWTEAEQIAEMAIALRPEAFTGYWYKGMAQLQSGQLAEARASFAKVVELNPQHHNANAILEDIDRALKPVPASVVVPQRQTPAGKTDWRVQ